MKATILITGAGGFTGGHACRYFAQQGFTVAAAVRSKDASAPNGAHLHRCDLTDKQQVKELVEEVQPAYTLHLAGRNAVSGSWQEPYDCMEANLLSTLYLLEALREQPDNRLLIVGSMLGFDLTASAPEPLHPYSLAKTMQVLLARAWSHLFRQQVLIAQPSNLIGPGNSNGICSLLASRIAHWERGEDAPPFRLSSEHEARDYLDVRDAVAAYGAIMATGKPGLVYSVCSGQQRTLGDIVRVFTALTPISLPIEIGTAPLLPSPQPMDSLLLRQLGWKPAIPFQESLNDALQFYRGL